MDERIRVGGEGGLSGNIVSEKIRRQKFNDSLYALRGAVPNITKMDKASVIKDAIEYIESMHSEERRIEAEICEMMESAAKARMENDWCVSRSGASPTSHHPIEILELRVTSMREEKTIVVSLTCSDSGRNDALVKLCQLFESLNIQIITATISSSSGRLCNTLFLQGDEDEKEILGFKIKAAIAALNDPESSISI